MQSVADWKQNKHRFAQVVVTSVVHPTGRITPMEPVVVTDVFKADTETGIVGFRTLTDDDVFPRWDGLKDTLSSLGNPRHFYRIKIDYQAA